MIRVPFSLRERMPKKPITWVGSIVILAAGVFCTWSLLRYRNAYGVMDTRSYLITGAALFLAPILVVVAIYLWHYFNERYQKTK